MDSEIKHFLESCPIGKTTELEVDAYPLKKYLANIGGGLVRGRGTQPHAWVAPIPRLKLFCSVCNGMRNFNPSPSYSLTQACVDLGQGPRTYNPGSGKEIVTGQHVDQFLRSTCGDCNKEVKKYSLAVEILSDLPAEGKTAKAKLKLTKFGEIPKPIKPINPKIKRLIKAEWEMYRKGADDEAAGNGIGAFAYYRRVVEASRDLIVDSMCTAASKLNVPDEDIQKIQESKKSRSFTESIAAVDHLFPSELKFNDQNALLALYGPLSEGLHKKSDEECLEAASHIRTLLDALGERLEQVIEQEETIQNALKGLQSFTTETDAKENK